MKPPKGASVGRICKDPRNRWSSSHLSFLLFSLHFSVMNHLLRAQCRNVIKRNVNRPIYFTTISGIRQEERLPWFVDPDFAAKKVPSESLLEHQPIPGPSRTVGTKIKPLPPGVPSLISELYYELAKSPLLEPGSLEVRNPLPSMPGPPLPKSFPKGRRRRGGTDFGEGIPDPEGGLWKWIVLAQVCFLELVTTIHVTDAHSAGKRRDRGPRIYRINPSYRAKDGKLEHLTTHRVSFDFLLFFVALLSF